MSPGLIDTLCRKQIAREGSPSFAIINDKIYFVGSEEIRDGNLVMVSCTQYDYIILNFSGFLQNS